MEITVTHTVESLYAEHGERIQHYFLKSLMDPETAADLTQDVFVRLSHVADTRGLPESAPKLLDMLAWERLKKHRRSLARRADAGYLEVPLSEAGDRSYPALDMATAEFRADFDRAVRDLPPAERDVFILNELRGLTVRETAELLGVPRASVGDLAVAARGRIKTALT